jgi:phytoene synthase
MSLTTPRATPTPNRDLGGAYAFCEALIRDVDKDRYLASLFAPAASRPHLFALYAFSFEVSRVREVVSEPLPGEVRLQWWRDALSGPSQGSSQSNPVSMALLDTIERFRLPVAPLVALIDVRIFDLYDDPMPTVAELEGYCGETCSALIRLASLILAGGEDPGGAEAAGHAGDVAGRYRRGLPRSDRPPHRCVHTLHPHGAWGHRGARGGRGPDPGRRRGGRVVDGRR